jgi:hypothetical protein
MGWAVYSINSLSNILFRNVFKGLICDGPEHRLHSLKKQLRIHGLQIVIAKH